jgi:hypothetical protein
VTESPIDQLLGAVDRLDVEAAMALMAPGCHLLTADGHRAEGTDAVRELLTDFVATLRSAKHRVTAEWHQDDVWIAEVDVSYELKDWLKTGALPRAYVVRDGPDGFLELHVYGANERPLADHRSGEEGMRLGGRWLPPL